MRYEPATHVASGPQPGAVALRDYAHSRGFADVGIFNPRTVRGSTSTLSLHAEGRAVDLTRGGRSDRQLTGFLHELIDHHERLGVQMVIWQRESWRVGRTWRPYHGVNPHTAHAHVELTRAAAAGLSTAIIADVLEGSSDMTDEERRMLKGIYDFLFTGLNAPIDLIPGQDHGGHALLSMNAVVQSLPGRFADVNRRLGDVEAAMPRALDVDLLATAIATRLDGTSEPVELEGVDLRSVVKDAVIEALTERPLAPRT